MKNHQKGFILPLILVIVAILAVGTGVYFVHKSKVKSEYSGQQAGIDAETLGQISLNGQEGVGTLRRIIDLKKSVACEVVSQDPKTSGTGKVFIAGMDMRGDFFMTNSGSTTVNSHFIRNGNDVYVWQGARGIRISLDTFQSATSSAHTDAVVNLDDKITYKCNEWKRDDTAFAMPKGVAFIDVEDMLKKMGTVNPTVKVNGGGNVDVKNVKPAAGN